MKTYNESETQLKEFLNNSKDTYTQLSLRPQGDSRIIEKSAINLCSVHQHGKDYLFGGISETFYDKMVKLYSWREKGVINSRVRPNITF